MSKAATKEKDPMTAAIEAHDQAVRGTEIIRVVDETGSMLERKPATISAINEFLGTQWANPNPAWVTMTFFHSEKIRTPISGVELSKVANLADKDYQPNNMTPLYDAIGKTVRSVEKRREATPEKDRAAIIVLIVTDGQENASKEFTKEGITTLIKEKEKDGWSFVYVGANQDAWAVSAAIGIAAANTVSYVDKGDDDGLRAFHGTYSTMSLSTSRYRTAVSHTAGASLSTVGTKSFFQDPTKLVGDTPTTTDTVDVVKVDDSTAKP